MDALLNVRAFLQTTQHGSFAAAARASGTVPSVIAKRIDQLEHQLGVTLFHRSTRRLVLTLEGERLLPRCQKAVAAFDDLIGGPDPNQIAGRLRVRSQATPTTLLLAPIFCDFLAAHPQVELDLQLVDRLTNPVEDGVDIAIGTHSSSYSDVLDVALAPYPCTVCASPDYIARRGTPAHPRELAQHDCLVSKLATSYWRFEGRTGDVAVEVRPRLTVNDTSVLLEATCCGLGIAILPLFIARRDIEQGNIVQLLDDFRPARLWLKALVPVGRTASPTVSAMLSFLQERLGNAGLDAPVRRGPERIELPIPLSRQRAALRSLAASPAR